MHLITCLNDIYKKLMLYVHVVAADIKWAAVVGAMVTRSEIIPIRSHHLCKKRKKMGEKLWKNNEIRTKVGIAGVGVDLHTCVKPVTHCPFYEKTSNVSRITPNEMR